MLLAFQGEAATSNLCFFGETGCLCNSRGSLSQPHHRRKPVVLGMTAELMPAPKSYGPAA